MTTAQLIVVGAAVFVAAFVQALSGFGFGLLSVPVMTLAIDAKAAVVVASLIGVVVTVWQATTLRADADTTLVKRMLWPAYLGMPIGLFVFVIIDERSLRLVLGIAVLLAVLLLVTPLRVPVGAPLDIGAGFLSGVLNTSLSTNGPPIVFALQCRKMPAEHFRGTIQMFFALSNVVSLTLFVAAGKVTGDGLVAAAVAVPSVVVGQLAGRPIREHVHGERFRWLVLGLLIAAGISAIVSALR